MFSRLTAPYFQPVHITERSETQRFTFRDPILDLKGEMNDEPTNSSFRKPLALHFFA